LAHIYDRPEGLMIGQSGDSWKYTTMRIGWRYVAKCHYEGLGWIMQMSLRGGTEYMNFTKKHKEVMDSSQSCVLVIYIPFSIQRFSWQAHFNSRKCV
jgi:hypothetical protein